VNSQQSSYPFSHAIWLTAALFLSYLSVAMSLPVIPLGVSETLGFGNALSGLAVGIAFLSTILTRGWVGRLADTKGGKRSMRRGLLVYMLSTAICLLSTWQPLPHEISYGILILGRLLMGIGESLTLIGMLTWGLAMTGRSGSGRFFSIMGAGMYGSYALGGPLGVYLYMHAGFAAAMLACFVTPLLGLIMIAFVPTVIAPTGTGPRESFWRVTGWIWRHGAVVGLQGVGFAALGAFLALLFQARGWPNAGFGLSAFAIGFIVMRLIGGRLLERLGAIRLSAVSLAIEAAAQFLLWTAPNPNVALAGSLLTGLGASMIYPAMGVEVINVVPASLRGTAMAGFSAFVDIANGLTGPLAGFAADRFGQSVVFLIGGLAAVLGLVTLLSIHHRRKTGPIPV